MKRLGLFLLLALFSGPACAARVSGGGTASVAGSTTQLQYNDTGALGASANLNWNKTSEYLGIGLVTPGYTLHLRKDSSLGGPNIALENQSTSNVGYYELGRVVGPFGTTSALYRYRHWAVGADAGGFVWGDASTEKMKFDATNGRLHVGDSTGTATLTLKAPVAGTSPLFEVQDSTGRILLSVSYTGHVITTSTQPVLSSCGTSPALSTGSNDFAGTVTVGASATGCTVTFGNAYAAAPTCVVSERTMSLVNALSYTTSASALTLTESSFGGVVFDYVCIGH